MDGKAALVTGAASGLGRATARSLAKAGADVCLVDRNAAGLEETAQQLGALGRRTVIHAADLSEAAPCYAAVAAAVAAFGRLDALCHAAGLIVFAHSTDMSVEDWNRTLNVNLSAAFFLSQAAIPHLLKVGGAIVHVASSAAFIGEAYAAAYCASKAGLVALTKAMAMEYIHQPIRINAVAPGGMATGIAANLRIPDGADPSLIKRFSGIRGLVDVNEVADMICHLASPAGRAFHGSCVTMDSGNTAG